MATNIYQAILDKAKQIGMFNTKSALAKTWFRRQAQQFTHVNANELLRSDPTRFLNQSRITPQTIGKMVMFFYDPKTKKKLPYYDRFPLIFPVDFPAKGGPGFYGINMHYLSPALRARLFDALYRALIENPGTEQQRLNISYGILKAASQFSAYKPCFKRYLYSHVRSRFFVVKPEEWDTILFLPLARFERGGAGGGTVGGSVSRTRVYNDSARQS
jgi:hypothetical protein